MNKIKRSIRVLYYCQHKIFWQSLSSYWLHITRYFFRFSTFIDFVFYQTAHFWELKMTFSVLLILLGHIWRKSECGSISPETLFSPAKIFAMCFNCWKCLLSQSICSNLSCTVWPEAPGTTSIFCTPFTTSDLYHNISFFTTIHLIWFDLFTTSQDVWLHLLVQNYLPVASDVNRTSSYFIRSDHNIFSAEVNIYTIVELLFFSNCSQVSKYISEV